MKSSYESPEVVDDFRDNILIIALKSKDLGYQILQAIDTNRIKDPTITFEEIPVKYNGNEASKSKSDSK